jgi:nucleoside-diphosphate-sugar epimerase
MGETASPRICVTGASGQAGRAVVAELVEHGYQVVATDIAATREDVESGALRADLTDYGQALEALKGADAVIHLANIPAPGICTPAVTFNANVTMNFNVFHAAARLGLRRVVWASSETTLGLFFGIGPQQWPSLEAEGLPPRYAPVDEDHYPLPTTTYALSKVASETIAEHIAQWSGIPFVALRFSNIMRQNDYEEFPSFWPDPHARKWNLWGYVDVRDVAAACRLALEAPAEAVASSPSFIIAAADTVMNCSSSALLAEVFPGVPLTGGVGEFDTLLAIDRARQTIGYEPQHSWRDHMPAS